MSATDGSGGKGEVQPAATVPGDDGVADLASRLRVAVARLNRSLRQQSELELTPTKVAHLTTIARDGPMSLGDLATAEHVAPATVTKVVTELEAMGFVTRERDTADRRVSRVGLTDQGRIRLESSRTRRTAWLARRLDSLDPAALDRLAAAIDVLEHLAESDRS